MIKLQFNTQADMDIAKAKALPKPLDELERINAALDHAHDIGDFQGFQELLRIKMKLLESTSVVFLPTKEETNNQACVDMQDDITQIIA